MLTKRKVFTLTLAAVMLISVSLLHSSAGCRRHRRERQRSYDYIRRLHFPR